MAPPTLEEVTLQTLNLLEWRLKRLEFVLNGGDATFDESKHASGAVAVVPRIQKLEQSLRRLANKSDVASDLLKLRTF
jgi:hypothetical protein